MTPDQGDVFYLRLLLYHTADRSFEQMKARNDTVHPTFEDAARAMGILRNDKQNVFAEGCHI